MAFPAFVAMLSKWAPPREKSTMTAAMFAGILIVIYTPVYVLPVCVLRQIHCRVFVLFGFIFWLELRSQVPGPTAISVALLHSLIEPAFDVRVCTFVWVWLSNELVIHQSGSLSISLQSNLRGKLCTDGQMDRVSRASALHYMQSRSKRTKSSCQRCTV